MTVEKVFVTGASGFIAQHIVVQLLKRGHSVIGTVRSKEKGESLKSLLNSDNFLYEIVPDIVDENAFDDALKIHPDISVVLHTASPFHFKSSDPDKEVIEPAIRGTKNALAAIKKYAPQVNRVVVTSSYASICPAEMEGDASAVITEETWNNISREDAAKTPVSGYRGSKALAEKAAWEFMKEEHPNFSLTCVNPGFVFGPQAFNAGVKKELNTSSELINQVLKLKFNDEVPLTKGSFVDVRDVALAHILSFEKPIVGKRLLVSAGRFSAQDILDIINENFPSVKGKIPVGKPNTGKDIVAKLAKIDNTKTKELLGFEFITLENTIIDSVAQILEVSESRS